ncbi:MAG TPA: hypothetical protein VFG83_05605 [Kofleriaceae bacterium]|nr:hypothetical protein [Kofleriaceae bacterium]
MTNRFLSSGLAAALALSVATFGCGDKNKSKKANGDDTAAAPATAATATAAAPGLSKTAFAVFPKDSVILGGVNLSGLAGSAFWPMVEAKMSADPKYQEVVAACGFNPLSKIEQVLFAGNPDHEDVVAVVKGFTKEDIQKCGAAAAKTEGKTLTMTAEGNLTKITVDDEVAYLAWLDDKTFAFSSAATSDADDIEAGKKALAAHAAGTDGLDQNADMMALLKKVDTSATVFFIGDISKMKDAPMDGKAKSAFASLLVKDGLKIDAGATFSDAETAKAVLTKANGMVAMVQGMKPELADLVSKVKLSVTGSDLIVQANLTKADLDKLQSTAKSMLPGMAGGMPNTAAKPATP